MGEAGPSGYSGFSGISGLSGHSGDSGTSGFSGFTGRSGTSGISGTSGTSGFTGQSGTSGFSSESGQSGHSGISGTSGWSGTSGESGTSGFSGFTGQSGTSGESGASGQSGTSGFSGFTGQSGQSGISGESGSSGHSGVSGYSGFDGSLGSSGQSGQSGQSGTSGESGTSGFSGGSGASGAHGTSGASGKSGTSGISGRSGWSGPSGTSGRSGYSGQSGTSGARGDSGYSGVSGGVGGAGDSGTSGTSGSSGTSGQSGYSGAVSGVEDATVLWLSAYSAASGTAVPNFSAQVFSGTKYHLHVTKYSGFNQHWSAAFPTCSDGPVIGGLPGVCISRMWATNLADEFPNWHAAFTPSADGWVKFKVSNPGTKADVNMWLETATHGSGYSGASGAAGDSGTSGVSGFSSSSGVSGQSGSSGQSGYSGQGESGTSGFSGYSGQSGTSGASGTSGTSGASGTSGFSGQDGSQGEQGDSGASGFSGFSGQGESGTSGYSGSDGSAGESGTSGYSGLDGSAGESGTSGFSGASGQDGSQGESGTSGFSGQGESGASGYSGAEGSAGSAGDSGYSGYSGIAGISAPDDQVQWLSAYSAASGTSVPGFSAVVTAGEKYFMHVTKYSGANQYWSAAFPACSDGPVIGGLPGGCMDRMWDTSDNNEHPDWHAMFTPSEDGVVKFAVSNPGNPADVCMWTKRDLAGSGYSGQSGTSGVSGHSGAAPVSPQNIVHNPQFLVAQKIRNDLEASVSGWSGLTNGYRHFDRWKWGKVSSGSVKVNKVADVPNYNAATSLEVKPYVTDSSVAASDFQMLYQNIEGTVLSSLMDKPMTVSFWVKSNVTGTYCVNLRTSGGSYHCCSEYTVNSSGTWEQKVIDWPAPSDSGHSWVTNTSSAATLEFNFMCGTTYQTATTDQWAAGNKLATANQTNFMTSTSNYFRITGIQLQEAPGNTKFNYDPASDLMNCYRYYEVYANRSEVAYWYCVGWSGSYLTWPINYRVRKRVTPTCTLVGVSQSNLTGNPSCDRIGADAARLLGQCAAAATPKNVSITTTGLTISAEL